MASPLAELAKIWPTLSQKHHSRDERRFYIEWLVVALLALSTLSLFTLMGWGKPPGHIIYDQFHRWRAPLPSNDIVIIGIDDASLQELGGWPLKRSVYADLLQKLADTGNQPKAIGFDILFPDPSPHDAALAAQMRRHNSYLAVEQPRRSGLASVPIHKPQAVLQDAAKGMAHINVTFESDGFSRGAYLQEGTLPHLSLAVSGMPAAHYLSHGAYRRFNLVDPEIGFPIVSLADALSDNFPVGLLKDKYVLIGSIAPSLGDHFPTIYSGREGTGTPGVVLHANLLNDILRGSLISPVPMVGQLALSLWAVLSVLIALMVLSPLAELIVTLIIVGCALVVSFVLLLAADVWFDPGLCILAIGLLKPAWAWRRTEMIVRFMGDRAAKLEKVQRSRKTLASGGLKLRHFASDTVLQYSRLLDKAIGASSERLEFLNRIVNEIPTAMLVADAEQRILLASPRMRQDIPAGLLSTGQPLLPLMFYLGMHKTQDLHQLSGQDHYVSGVDTNGTIRYYIFRVAQLPQNDDGSLWVFALTDITQIRQFQNQREQTLQLLSHDMRTPIASIIALSRQSGPEVGTVAPQTAANIYRHADTLLNMMDDFIFSIKAQAHEYQLSETLVDSVIDDAIYQVKDLAHGRQMRLLQTFDDEPQFVMADQRLLTRMLVNLLVNAVRYGQPQTDIHITLSHDNPVLAPATAGAPAVDEPPQMVHITLCNTVGEPDDASRPRHMASQGFGLGLTFVKTVVRKHQGHIQIDLPTQAGATAEVRVQMPMAKPYC
jgi:CHASE2 domain-containing sensor protein/signal transduction histidine kinase